MQRWPERAIENAAQLLTIARELRAVWPNPSRCFFRGQPIAEWSLKPSLLRLYDGKAPSVAEMLATEQHLRHEFRDNAGEFIQARHLGSHEKDLLGWWAPMRHFGAPTRLLDWTLSPFVALFFAVEANWDQPGAIWFVRFKAVQTIMVMRNPNQYPENAAALVNVFRAYDLLTRDEPEPELYFFERTAKFDRMSVQQGWFSVCADPRVDHAEPLSAIGDIRTGAAQEPLPGCHFMKYTVPAERKPEILRELHLMNITAKSLFPGIDGLGRALCGLGQLSTRYGNPPGGWVLPDETG